jgi:hypothetical protein
MDNPFLAVAALAAAFYFYISSRKQKTMDCTQDLVDYKNIFSDGLVELPGQKFRKVIEVTPINLATKSHREQSSIWENYRAMINSLVFPATFLVQSTHVDVSSYIANLNASLDEIDNAAVKYYGAIHEKHIMELSETKAVRSQRYYIIVKIDITSASIDSGVEVEDNTVAMAINAVLRAANRPKSMSTEEAERLARSELDNMITVIRSYLTQMDITSIVLDKEGIADMVYTTYNRDLANIVRTKEVGAMEAFHLFTKSLTPDITGEIIDERGDTVA